MILNLQKSRDEYFTGLTEREILKQYFQKDGPITIKDLQQIEQQGKVVVGSKEGSLEGVLQRQYSIDSKELVNKIDSLPTDSLLLLPPEYRINGLLVREVVVYDIEKLLKLDSMAVKRS